MRGSISAGLLALLLSVSLGAQAPRQEGAAYDTGVVLLKAGTTTVTLPLRVDQTPQLDLQMTGAKELKITLVSPAGARFVVGETQAAGFEGTVFPLSEDPQSPQFAFSLFRARLDAPPPGTWGVELSAVQPPIKDLSLVWTAHFNNRVVPFLLSAQETVPLGTPLRLSLAVTDGPQLLRGMSVSARLLKVGDAGFRPQELNFGDGGTGADPAAGDGVYTAELRPDLVGDYFVVARVTGSAAGGTFVRTTGIRFKVFLPPARLTGRFEERTVAAVPGQD